MCDSGQSPSLVVILEASRPVVEPLGRVSSWMNPRDPQHCSSSKSSFRNLSYLQPVCYVFTFETQYVHQQPSSLFRRPYFPKERKEICTAVIDFFGSVHILLDSSFEVIIHPFSWKEEEKERWKHPNSVLITYNRLFSPSYTHK